MGELRRLPCSTRSAQGVEAGKQAIRDQEAHLGEHVNGWQVTLDMGRYGTRYAYRAAWTFFGVGGNLIEDACYPLATTDGNGEPLDSAHRYTLHFDHDALPPVNAFWSLTMYDPESYLVANAIDRYALGDRSGLSYDDDGSLTLYIQREQPDAATEANWLPTPSEGALQGRAQALLAQARGRPGHVAAATDRTRRLRLGGVGAGLSLSPEAVAYIGGDPKRSVSRRLICLGDLPEGLRTAHIASPLLAGRAADLCDSQACQGHSAAPAGECRLARVAALAQCSLRRVASVGGRELVVYSTSGRGRRRRDWSRVRSTPASASTRGQRLALAQERAQDMLGRDLRRLGRLCLLKHSAADAVCVRGEGQDLRRKHVIAAGADNRRDPFTDLGAVDGRTAEMFGCVRAFEPQQTKEQMLGADVSVAQPQRFLFGTRERLLGADPGHRRHRAQSAKGGSRLRRASAVRLPGVLSGIRIATRGVCRPGDVRDKPKPPRDRPSRCCLPLARALRPAPVESCLARRAVPVTGHLSEHGAIHAAAPAGPLAIATRAAVVQQRGP